MGKRILVVDDDAMIRNVIGRFLERGGYSVITASEGQIAVEKYKAESPDLIVLDIAMPGMTGFEVATAIRAIERSENRPRTPIILLTAYARSFFVSVGSEAGIDSYLTKPISPEQLLEHVNRFLVEKPDAPTEKV